MADRFEEGYSLGAWLRRRRKALALTQAALAQQVGCAEVTIRKLELDILGPSQVMAERLARCLDLPPEVRTVFLQVAQRKRNADSLPSPLTGLVAPSPTPDPESTLEVRLPVATIPPPAPLPPGSRMTLRRNPLFVGRVEDLSALAHALNAGTRAAIGQREIAAATGLGGIGKTQLACEFVHRYGQFFPGGVFWLSFADPAAVPAEVAACGGDEGMGLSVEFGTLPLEKQVRQVLTAWASPLPRLLIFDNCEDEALLDHWLPIHGGCCVLLTSRRHHWDAALGVQAVPLDVLARRDSLALLHAFRPDLPADDADLAAIAEALGDLPLALHLAGSFLAKYPHSLTPAQYLARLHTPTLLDDRSLREAGLSPTRHVQHVARTFEQSYERLDPANPTDALARALLAHAAYFAPGEPIPRWLLFQTLDLPDDDAERALAAEDALMRLIDLGLLETEAAGNLRLHRLVVAFVQAVLGDETAQAAVEATMLRVADSVNQQRNPRPLLSVQPHLRYITEVAQPRADGGTAGLCNALGFHLWQLGVYPEAQSYLAQALAIRQGVLGDDHPDTAITLNNLGRVFWAQGQYAAAQCYHEQALAIQQRVLGADHPATAWSLNNLGVVLQDQGQYADAQRYYEQALAIRQRVLGDDHPDTAWSLNNLGAILRVQGQYAAAQRYHEQALAIYQRVLGADHPVTAWSLKELGVVLREQGQYAAAQRYHEQALAIYQRVFGANHPVTARSLRALGELLHARGTAAQARRFLEQALMIQEQMMGGDHPDTARSLHSLGEVLRTQGELAKAKAAFERALTIFEQRLGPQHRDTEQTRRTLATLDAARTVGDSE